MKKSILILTLLIGISASAQEKKLYSTTADAEKELKAAVKTAAQEKKFVLVQGGGNWCKWCIEFARFANADREISEIINANFVWYHLNYSTENKNEPVFSRLGYPQRFGFPVFIILDSQGNRIHTQNSEYLEDGKSSYDAGKVKAFLQMWSPAALDPSKYNTGQ